MEDEQPSKEKLVENSDRISQLPDNLIGIIISNLTMREAVRTSVLSTRWRYLWTTSLSNLKFDVDNILPHTKDYSDIGICTVNHLQGLVLSRERMLNFIHSVEQFLLHLSSDHKIDKLKVYFTFCNDKYSSHLDQWISFAISRGIEELDLSLLEDGYFGVVEEDIDPYDFPCLDLLLDDHMNGRGLSPSIKCLRLASCILAPKLSQFIRFNTLTTLDLMCVDLKSDQHVQHLLSSSFSLEWLSLYTCYNIRHLKINSPFCRRLKYLNIYDCNELKVIEINGVDLEKFEYKGFIANFLFRDVPQLKTISSHVSHWSINDGTVWSLTRLANDLPQLETLMLITCSCYREPGKMPERLPTFLNLKILSIVEIAIFKRDLLWTSTLIKASPSLQRLEMHLHTYEYDEEPREINTPPICPHDHLREVVITGTRGLLSEIEIAIYLLNNAILLEKMMIDPRPRYYNGDSKWNVTKACEAWIPVARQRVIEHLMGEASPLVELLIL